MSQGKPGRDLYAVLGVPRTATHTDLDRAYRALVRRHHPNSRTTTDPAQASTDDATLQLIQAAYAVLRNPDRRAAYDRLNPPPPTAARTVRAGHVRPVTSATWPLPDPPLRAGPVHWKPPPSSTR